MNAIIGVVGKVIVKDNVIYQGISKNNLKYLNDKISYIGIINYDNNDIIVPTHKNGHNGIESLGFNFFKIIIIKEYNALVKVPNSKATKILSDVKNNPIIVANLTSPPPNFLPLTIYVNIKVINPNNAPNRHLKIY